MFISTVAVGEIKLDTYINPVINAWVYYKENLLNEIKLNNFTFSMFIPTLHFKIKYQKDC